MTVTPSSATVEEGKSVSLTATVSPSQDLPVTWSAGGDKVSVSDNGTVTGISAGSATVTASIPLGASDSATVTVKPAPVQNTDFICEECKRPCPCKNRAYETDYCYECYSKFPICPECLNTVIPEDRLCEGSDLCKECGEKLTVCIHPANAKVTVGKTVQLVAVISENYDLPVTWSTADTDKISVSSDGTVTALSTGTATVTATIPGGAKATVTVEVITIDIPHFEYSGANRDTATLDWVGTFSVDTYTGALSMELGEISVEGSLLPVSIKHQYHSDFAKRKYTKADNEFVADFSGMDLGYGWRLNIMQSVVPTADTNVYAYINEDGECILLTYAEAVYDENGALKYAAGYRNDDYGLCYNSSEHSMTAEDGLKYWFTSDGKLGSIMDHEKGMGINIEYYNGKIKRVKDGANRYYTFEYDNNCIIITAPDGLKCIYYYSDGYLTGILRGEDKAAVIEYNADGTISSITALPGELNSHSMVFDYIDGRVNAFTEYYDLNSPAQTHYDYDTEKNSTLITRVTTDDDEDGTPKCVLSYTKYTFDSNGNIVSSFNHSDDVRYSPDVVATSPDGDTFGIVKTANLVHNGSFENETDGWSESFSNCSGETVTDANGAKFGNKYYKITANTSTASAALKQTVSLPAGDYTFSAYMKAENTADYYSAFLRVKVNNNRMESESLAYADERYVRLETHFTLTSQADVELYVYAMDKGITYIDGVMLEKAPCATEFNLIDNAGFEDGTAAWTVNGDVDAIRGDQFSGSASLRFGGGSSFAEIRQNIGVNSYEGTRETYTLSAWAKTGYSIADANKSEYASKCCIGAIMTYTDKNDVEKTEEFITEFAPGVYDWQNAAVYIEKPEFGSVTGLTVFARCENITSDVFFDSIALVRDSIETELAEEDFPDLDNGDNSEAPDTGFTEIKDDMGNNLTETTFGDDASLGAIYRSFTYTDDKNNLKTVRDERGNVTVYDVQNSSSRVLSETDPIGNKKEYEYDVHGRTTKVTHKDSFDTAIASVSYGYDEFDNLTSINRGDRGYSLTYNYMHQLDSITADNLTAPLVSYGYTHGGRPKSVTYANGDIMTAVYNAKGQIISEKWTRDGVLTAHYKYVYDMSDNLIRSIDIKGRKEYNYVYEDGVIVRSTECDITVNGETVEARTPVNTVLYTYNGGTLVKKRIIPENGFDTEQVYTYPKDNGNTSSCTFVRGDTTVTATSVTDGLGRAVSESITAGNVAISRAFTYTDGVAPLIEAPLDTNEYKPTTQLVKTIELSDGTVLDYEYDACGRITKVTETRNGTASVTEYTYDALGQLLTETVNGTAVNCMSYDSYGNITEKNGVSYSYDSTWKDRLKFVGNNEIEYGTDPCNPEKYFGNSLVWEKGRQLKKFGENISYKYNANGIRTRKTVNDRNHFYFLDGTKILRETWGTDTLVPIYDANESVIGLTRSTESGTNTYYFLKNLQGDIIALTDETGEVVARYTYDAWGKVLSVTDANGNSITLPFDIANVNPFRYRGYYYDTETGLYYLQSRYYDPSTGRFVNSDEAGLMNCFGAPASYSLFSYGDDNPINMTDPSGYKASKIYSGVVGFGVQVLLSANVLCYQGFVGFEALWFAFTKNNNFGNSVIPWCYWFVGGSLGLTLDFKKILTKNFINNPKNVLSGFGLGFSISVGVTFFLITANRLRSPDDYTRDFVFSSITTWGITVSKASGSNISTYGVGFAWEVGASLKKGISIGKKLFGIAKGTSYYWALPINPNAKKLYSLVESKV